MGQVLLYRCTTCLGSCGPARSRRPSSFPMLLFFTRHAHLLSDAWRGFLWSWQKAVTDTCNEFLYCGLWACVLWITEARNECSASPQWGGSPSSPWEQQFVLSGHVCRRDMVCVVCTDWMHIMVWLQGLQVHFKAYVRVVRLLQTFTPKITAGILSRCHQIQSNNQPKCLSCTPHSCRLGCICK